MIDTFSRYHFKGQHEDEHISHVIHRHWFAILVQFIGIAFVLALLIVSSIVLHVVFGTNAPSILDPSLVRFIESTLFLFIWFSIFFLWIDYWFDVWIVTDQRIVDIEQKGLFVREISELNISRIQDVTSEITGFIPSILNYGDVFIQTAGEQERFVLRQVPDPNAIKDMIMKRVHATDGNGLPETPTQ